MKPLQGVRILDFTQYTSGPIATVLLADLGAEVIKLENPPYGDSNYYNAPSVNKHNSFIASLDHNKKSVLLNVRDEKQKTLFLEMVKHADAVVDNFKTGTMKKLGIDFDVLSKINPRIVCASISGYGQDGPWAKRAAYDIIVQAVGGLMSVTGEKNGRALKGGFSLADISTGASCLPAILAGLLQARRTGRGCAIDCSMMDCAASILMEQIAYYGVTKENPDRMGNESQRLVPYGTYECRDGRMVMLCIHSDSEFAQLCNALGAEEWKNHPAFRTMQARLEKRETVNHAVSEKLANWESKELVQKLLSHGICCALVQNVHETDESEQLKVRNMTNALVQWPDGTQIRTVGCPIKISGVEDNENRLGPSIGADTLQVLSEFVPMEAIHEAYDDVLSDSRLKVQERSSKMK